MKVPSEDCLALLQPVLDDVARTTDVALHVRIVHDSDDASTWIVWDGGSSSIRVSDGGTRDEALAECADEVRMIVIEQLHGAWPVCPAHRQGPPLEVGFREPGAVWQCRIDGAVIADVGELPRMPLVLRGG